MRTAERGEIPAYPRAVRVTVGVDEARMVVRFVAADTDADSEAPLGRYPSNPG